MSTIDTLKEQRLIKLNKIKELGIDPYPNFFDKTLDINQVRESYKNLEKGTSIKEEVCVAGRIFGVRTMGKSSFLDVRDWTGKIQIYVKKGELQEKHFALLDLLDIGDIIGIKGTIFCTRTGELSVFSKELFILSKSIRPLPIVKEKQDDQGDKVKFNEVHDPEFKYRQRYVDLNINEKTQNTIKLRSQVLSFIRQYLVDKGFLEVETPILQVQPGGALAKPFVTHHNTLNMELYMRIAPELYLKRLVVGGIEKVFELGRNFRNEGISSKHNPEFTMLELYQSYADYNVMMSLTQDIITNLVNKLFNKFEIEYNKIKINFKSWEKMKLEDLFKKYVNIDLSYVENLEGIKKIADKLNINYEKNSNARKIYDHIFEEKIQPNLVNPTIVYDFPLLWSPLAKEKKENPTLVERFELFIAGMELANAYSELNDPIEQRKRMEGQIKEKVAGDDEAERIDEDYLRAMEYGMTPAGGLGIGIDRLIMILVNTNSIKDVIMFPHLKPEK